MSNVTVNISFQDSLLCDIDRVARAEARSRSELLREAARAYIQCKDVGSYSCPGTGNCEAKGIDARRRVARNQGIPKKQTFCRSTTPLRVVLDSNVIISGFLFGGQPARILGRAADGSVQCFTSLPIFYEIRDVLQRPKFGLSSEQVLAMVGELHDLCRIVTPTTRARVVAADPDDDMVLECAVAAGVNLIVSGDSHLLAMQQWNGIRILSPAEFIRQIETLENP